jgi:hypothetical protein
MKKKFYIVLICLVITSTKLFSQSWDCSLFCNGGADSTFITAADAFVTSDQIPCWHTTAQDSLMEVWSDGYAGVASYSGIQFFEMNAFYVSTLYQNITITPGSYLSVSFAHRGRAGVDTMSVSVGPVGGPYTTLGYFADGNTSWGYHTVTYQIPSGSGNNYSVRFNSIYATNNNPTIGNFLDAVTVCDSTIEEMTDCNMICNGDVDSTFITAADGFVTSAQLPCWHTTAQDSIMEVWADGYNGVSSYSGSQFLEMNAYYVSTLYQNITVTPGFYLAIGFAHRGRAGVDTMSVSIGPVGGPYTSLGYFADGNTDWGYHTVYYTVPLSSGTNYSVRFNSIYATLNLPTVGNFLDSVTVCSSNKPLGTMEVTGRDEFLIFPNPGISGIYHVAGLPSSELTYEVYNFTGKIISAGKNNGASNIEFNLSEFSSGIYFVRFNSHGKSQTQKIIRASH